MIRPGETKTYKFVTKMPLDIISKGTITFTQNGYNVLMKLILNDYTLSDTTTKDINVTVPTIADNSHSFETDMYSYTSGSKILWTAQANKTYIINDTLISVTWSVNAKFYKHSMSEQTCLVKTLIPNEYLDTSAELFDLYLYVYFIFTATLNGGTNVFSVTRDTVRLMVTLTLTTEELYSSTSGFCPVTITYNGTLPATFGVTRLGLTSTNGSMLMFTLTQQLSLRLKLSIPLYIQVNIISGNGDQRIVFDPILVKVGEQNYYKVIDGPLVGD